MVKISVIGAGMVGATAVQRLAERELGDVAMIDVIEGLPQGKALDLLESAPLCDFDVDVVGSNDYRDIEASNVVVVTAGVARKPGMSREDLININAGIVRDVCAQVVEHAPGAILLMVTNPLDIMTYAAWKYTGFEPRRVFGMSGVLDSARFSYFVAEAVDCSVRDVHAMVLGGHGDTMVPLPEYTTVSGIPLSQLLSRDVIEQLVSRTVKGGAEIVNLLKTGSAFYAPSAAIVKMVESIVRDSKRILPACAYLAGEYGQRDVYLGVPVKLGRRGIIEVIELELSEESKAALTRSADAVREGVAKLGL
jgi:malate dehydrogenase